MSAIFGAFNLSGDPLPAGILQQLAAGCRYRAYDGEAIWEGGPAGLGHGHHWTVEEEVGEVQPLVSRDGRYHLTADARIDNRDELIAELLGQAAAGERTPTDAELILYAFERWGEQCVPRLLGDFAFAIWDSRTRELFLARDVMGIRQLYHAVHNGVFFFANTIRSILAALPSTPALNRPLIEEFLRSYYRRWVRETALEGIERLPPAHQLTVSSQHRVERLYYVLGSQPPADFETDGEWIQGFEQVLREATRCRLRSRTSVAIVTGGGVDSSALACLANELTLQDPGLPAVELHAAYHAEPAADERAYFDIVSDHCSRFRSVRVDADEQWGMREIGTDAGFPLDEPELYALRSHSLALLRSVAASGSQVVLFGEGANQALGHSVYYNSAAILGIPLRNQLREFPHFIRASGNRVDRVLFHAFVRPLLPDGVVERLRPLRPGSAEWPDWVVKSKESSNIARPLSRDFTHPPGLTWSARLAHRALRSSFDIARFAALDVSCAYAGLELRLPFLDRRVVEFLLAAPPHWRSWNGEDRRILREAMRGVLPEAIRTRRDKASMAGLLHRGLRDRARGRIEELLTDSRAEALGFIRGRELRRALEFYWSDSKNNECRFLSVFALEAWLRTLPKADIIDSSGGNVCKT